MIARPVIRPKPISFADPVNGSTHGSASKASAKTFSAPPVNHLGPVSPITRRSPVQAHSHIHSHAAHTRPPVTARFLGHGALSVQSTLTGRIYRFQGQGDSQQVDHRDALMLGRIPDLMVG